MKTKPRLGISGFTIVEVLIAAGLAVGMVLTIYQVGNYTARSMHSAATSKGFLGLTTLVGAIATNEKSCRMAIGGPDNELPKGTPLTTPPRTIQSWGVTTNSDPLVANFVIYAADSTSTAPKVFLNAKDSAHNTYGDWQIKSITLETLNGLGPPSTCSDCMVPANVKITAVPADGSSTLTKVTRDLRLTLRLSATPSGDWYLVSCSPMNFGTDQYTAPTCPTYFAMKSDGAQLNCVRVACTPPAVPSPGPGGAASFAANGDLICY